MNGRRRFERESDALIFVGDVRSAVVFGLCFRSILSPALVPATGSLLEVAEMLAVACVEHGSTRQDIKQRATDWLDG